MSESAGMTGTTAVVLAGGLGTRLRIEVPDLPKVLAPVNGRPFLAYLLDRLASAGIRRAVICVGYRSHQVVEAFGPVYGRSRLELVYAVETRLRGTGGALRGALLHLDSDPVLVLNGDSYAEADLTDFYARHVSTGSPVSIMLVHAEETERFGRVATDAAGVVTGFFEKSGGAGPGWINAGVYLLSRAFIASVPEGQVVSLEHDLFPRWVGAGLRGVRSPGRFIDIGTPASYRRAAAFLRARTAPPPPGGAKEMAA
jgi:NDP-sugar pyrophosphorylase family protein